MQLPPPVEVIRTVFAVTAPLVAAGPNALTQSPTAKALDVVDWVVLTGVEPDVVMVSFSVFGGLGFFVFELDFVVRRAKPLPGFSMMPDTVIVEPLTAVTLPDAMSRLANCLRKLPRRIRRPGSSGATRSIPPSGKPPPPRNSEPPPPPPRKPPHRRRRSRVLAPKLLHDPVDVGEVTLIERAAMVVLDFFEAVPVTVTQSPAVSELTDSVTLLENCVVGVQFTVVWPVLAFCTSMLEVLRAATLPVAPIGFDGGGRARRSGGGHDGRDGDDSRAAGSQESGPAPVTGASAGGCLHRDRSSFLSLSCVSVCRSGAGV